MTPKMREALIKAQSPEGLGSWDFGAGTLGVIKKRGWVEARRETRQTGQWTSTETRYRITDSGMQALNNGERT